MGSLSVWHWVLMGDVAKGIKSFKKGLNDEDAAEAAKSADPVRNLDRPVAQEASKISETHKA